VRKFRSSFAAGEGERRDRGVDMEGGVVPVAICEAGLERIRLELCELRLLLARLCLIGLCSRGEAEITPGDLLREGARLLSWLLLLC
jgi:hypothetical protein